MDQLRQLGGFLRIHPGGGFVEEQNLRLRRQCPGNLQLALLPIRQILRQRRLFFRQADNFQQFHRFLQHALFLAVIGRQTQNCRQGGILHRLVHRQLDVVQHGHVFKQPDILKRPRQPQAGDHIRL